MSCKSGFEKYREVENLLRKIPSQGALAKFRNDGSNVVLGLKKDTNIRLNKTV